MQDTEQMIKNAYSVRDFLNYYKNSWTRNMTARLIDVQNDTIAKSIDPDMQVQAEDGREVAVKVRLEHRKIVVQDALNLIAAINALLALDDAGLAASYSKDALKIAADMIQKPVETAVAAPLVKYKVVNDTGFSHPNHPVAVKDSIVELDPKAEATIAGIASGAIILDGAPSAEAKV